MWEVLLPAIIGGAVSIAVLILNRVFSSRDEGTRNQLNLTTADRDSRDKFLDRILKRVECLEDDLAAQHKNSEDRERRISELEREAEKCALNLAMVMAQNQELSTLRRYFERELNRSEILRAAYDSSLLAIIMADSNGDIITWNPAATNLFQFDEYEVIGRSIVMLMPDEYRHRHEEGFKRAKETGTFRHMGRPMHLRGLRKDGSEIPITLRLQTWKVDGSNYYSATIFATDDPPTEVHST